MPLKPLPYRIIKSKLEAAGFIVVSQKGSHVKFAKDTPEGKRTAIVPNYSEVTIGTLRSILKQAGLTDNELIELYFFLNSLNKLSYLNPTGNRNSFSTTGLSRFPSLYIFSAVWSMLY